MESQAQFTLPAVNCCRFFERQQMSEREGRAKPGEGPRKSLPEVLTAARPNLAPPEFWEGAMCQCDTH